MELHYIYIYGWLVFSAYLVKELSFRDFATSHIAGLLWPISLPAFILKRILK